MNKKLITFEELASRASITAGCIAGHFSTQTVTAFPVSGDSVSAAFLVQQYLPSMTLVELPIHADLFIGVLLDSGATKADYAAAYPNIPFFTLFDKSQPADSKRGDLIFPWAQTVTPSKIDIPTQLLQFIGEDIHRGGLKDTPQRFLNAWAYWTSGYNEKPEDIVTTFDDGAEDYDEMILVKNIPAYSHCEHHLAVMFGVAHIAYIPNGKIVGLSKLNRVVGIYGRRLQVQERWTDQIADAIRGIVQPTGVAVTLECRHMCMESRGICQQGHSTTTSAMHGAFRDDPETRNEYLQLIR